MNMRWYDRILVSLSGLVLMALGVAVMLAGGGVIHPELFKLDYWIGDGWQWMPVIFLGGLILLAWGVWLLVRPFLRSRDKNGRYYTVRDEGEGEVHISVQALDHLVHKALSVWPEILTAQVRIGGQEDAMQITLRATLQSNVRIPELINDVRTEIKQYVEECAGVTVQKVRVIIESTKDARGQQATPDVKMMPLAPEPRKVMEPERIFAVRQTEAETEATPEAVKEPEPEPVQVIVPPQAEEPAPIEPEAVEEEIDLGPVEPLPVTLSEDAFPFPEAEDEQAEADATGTEEETRDA